MIFESKYFKLINLDGTNEVTSITLGIVNAVVSNGMHKQQIVGARKILETRIPGRATPYFYGVDKSPLQFKISLATEIGKDIDDLNNIVSEFFSENYRTIEFYIAGNLTGTSISYDFVVVGSPEIEYISDSTGKHAIISLNMRCNSFSGYLDRTTGVSPIAGPLVINNGYHEAVYPDLKLTATATTISIETDSENLLSISGCTSGDVITVDMSLRTITSVPARSVYSDWNKKYLKLNYDDNTVTPTGCTWELNWKEPKLL